MIATPLQTAVQAQQNPSLKQPGKGEISTTSIPSSLSPTAAGSPATIVAADFPETTAAFAADDPATTVAAGGVEAAARTRVLYPARVVACLRRDPAMGGYG